MWRSPFKILRNIHKKCHISPKILKANEFAWNTFAQYFMNILKFEYC